MCDTYFNIFFSTFFLFTTFTFIHFLTTPTLSYWYYLDLIWSYMVISVQFRCSVVSDSLQHHGLQNARPHCPSPDPWVYSNSCALSPWCHPTISFSIIPFSSCLQSFPASVFSSESVLCIRWPKYWSFSFSISPSNEYSGLISFRMDWLDLLPVQGTLKSSTNNIVQKHQFFGALFSL